MRRVLVPIALVTVVAGLSPAQAVIDGRGSVLVAGGWEPSDPHVPETRFSVLLVASNEPTTLAPECPGTTTGCPLGGLLHVTGADGWSYRGRVTCMWVEEPRVYLGVFGGSGDIVTFGAAYASAGLLDPGEPDTFALLQDLPFDCHDEEVRERLRVRAGTIRPGKAVVASRCPPIMVCPDRSA